MPPFRYYMFDPTISRWMTLGWDSGRRMEWAMEQSPKDYEGWKLAKLPL